MSELTPQDIEDPWVYTGGGTAMRRSKWRSMTQEERDAHWTEASKIQGYTNFPPPDRVTPDFIVEERK